MQLNVREHAPHAYYFICLGLSFFLTLRGACGACFLTFICFWPLASYFPFRGLGASGMGKPQLSASMLSSNYILRNDFQRICQKPAFLEPTRLNSTYFSIARR